MDRTFDRKETARFRIKENNEAKLKMSWRQCQATLVHNSPMISGLERLAHQLGCRELSSN